METKQTTTNLSPSPNKGNTQRKLTFSLTNESQEYNALGYSKYTPLVRSDFDMSIIEKWIEVRASNAPKRRCQHSSFIYNNNLYVYGGVDIGEGRMNDLHRMNIENLEDLKWEEIKSSGASPEPVSGQSSIIVENKLYMFGGENSRQQATNNLYILDLDQLKWEKRIFIENDIPNMMGHTANYNHFDNSLIIFGGFAKGKYLNTVYSYSIEKLYWELNETAQTELPEGRIYHSAVLAEDALYIYGGVNIDGNYLGDMWKFDLVSKLWEKILPANKGEDDIPLPRCGHTMTYHPETNSIFIFGGKISNIQERNEFWKFDIKKNSFELMHDTLIEQHNDFNQTDNSFSHKNSFSRKSKIIIILLTNKIIFYLSNCISLQDRLCLIPAVESVNSLAVNLKLSLIVLQ